MANETWFDTGTGGVFMDVPGRPPRALEDDPNIVPLAQLLTTPDFAYDRRSFDKAEVDGWAKEDYIERGRWLLTVLEEVGKEPIIKTTHLQRLYMLGLGPEYQRYSKVTRYFSNLEAFRQEVGSKSGYERNKYDVWSNEKWTNAARGVEAAVKRKPRFDDYQQAAEDGQFPTKIPVERNIGSYGKLNELLGYPDVKRWRKEDFVTFGLNFIEINSVEIFSFDAILILSARERGPSDRLIHKHFGTWSNFYNTVLERLPAHLAQVDQARLHQPRRVARYNHLLKNGMLPPEYAGFDELSFLKAAGMHTLTVALLGRVTPQLRNQAAEQTDRRSFEVFIHKINPSITFDAIIKRAKELEVYDDIWATEYTYKDYLVVEESELRKLNAKQAAKLKRDYQRKRALRQNT